MGWLDQRIPVEVEAMLARQRALVAREIADAIRMTTTRPHRICPAYPDCAHCARTDQARADVSLALRIGQTTKETTQCH